MSSAQTISTISGRRIASRMVLLLGLSVGSSVGERSAYGDDSRSTADRLFSEGLRLARDGDCARARASFAASYAADPAPGTLINWGLCEETLGHTATALGLLRLAEQRLSADHPKLSEVKKQLAALRERVPQLWLHPLRLLPAGTVVLKDAEKVELSSLDRPQPGDPGAHVIEVRAPGHEVRRYEVTLSEGRTVDLAFEPGAPQAPTPTTSPVEMQPGNGDPRALGWIAGGAGIAAVGVGAVTGLLALSRWHEVQRDCDIGTKTCRTEEGTEASPAGRSLATVSTVAFAVGAVGLLGGGYILLTTRGPTVAGATPPVVALTANGNGIQVSGAF